MGRSLIKKWGGMEKERDEVRTQREKAREKTEILYIHHCLMPVVCLCNYSPLSLACSCSFPPSPRSPSLSLPLPHHSLFFYIPLFALFLLICANHHETTATLEPLTGTAWHPARAQHIIAQSHTHMLSVCICILYTFLNSQL